MAGYIAYSAQGNVYFTTRMEIADFFKLTNEGVSEAINSGCPIYRYGERIPYYIDILEARRKDKKCTTARN